MLGIVNNMEMSNIGKSKVRRCLFGPPDHDSIRKELRKATEESNKEIKFKWNFDFEKETPLDGRYSWEIVTESEYIPEFYRKGYVPRKPIKVTRKCIPVPELNKSMDSDSDDEGFTGNVCDDSETDILAKPLVYSSDEDDSSQENKCNKQMDSVQSCSAGSKKKQSQIIDFMKKRKRTSTLNARSKLRRLDL